MLFVRLFVDPLGLEPRMTVPKTGVLPLHHRSISLCGCKDKSKFYLSIYFLYFFFEKKSQFFCVNKKLRLPLRRFKRKADSLKDIN